MLIQFWQVVNAASLLVVAVTIVQRDLYVCQSLLALSSIYAKVNKPALCIYNTVHLLSFLGCLQWLKDASYLVAEWSTMNVYAVLLQTALLLQLGTTLHPLSSVRSSSQVPTSSATSMHVWVYFSCRLETLTM